MADITITIQTAQVNRVLNAIATKYGYTGFLADGITAQTKAAFAKEWIRKLVMAAVKEQEGNTLAAAAVTANAADIDTNIVIT